MCVVEDGERVEVLAGRGRSVSAVPASVERLGRVKRISHRFFVFV